MALHETVPKIKELPDPNLWLIVAFEKWHWEYGLGLSWLEVQDPIHEDKAIQIFGTTTLGKALLKVHLRVVPGSGLNEEYRHKKKNLDQVGTLSRIKGGFEGFIGIPDTALPMVLAMLSGNQYRSLELRLIKGSLRHYSVQRYNFRHEADLI